MDVSLKFISTNTHPSLHRMRATSSISVHQKQLLNQVSRVDHIALLLSLQLCHAEIYKDCREASTWARIKVWDLGVGGGGALIN